MDEMQIAMHFEDHYAACVVDAMKDYASDAGQPLSTVLKFSRPRGGLVVTDWLSFRQAEDAQGERVIVRAFPHPLEARR